MHTSLPSSRVRGSIVIVALIAACGTGTAVLAQEATQVGAPAFRSTGIPQRDTLARMMQVASADFTEARLEDVMKYIQDASGADMDIFWMDDRSGVGLDKDQTLSVKAKNITMLRFLEIVLERASTDFSGAGGNTWQMSESGAMQVGPKERLNKFRRLEIYPVRDLLTDVPNYGDLAPNIDLQSALQQGGQQGGGGGQSPFTGGNSDQDVPTRSIDEKAEELKQILIELVEPEQWKDNGGDGASIRFFQSSFLVNAPDYIHRGLNGYSYWPNASSNLVQAEGKQRRYVTLSVDNSIATLTGLTNVPVTGIAGGELPQRPPRGGG
jgi:hypothetical protein